MGGLEIFFLSFIIGFISTYIVALKYLRYLRGELKNPINDIALILTSLIWGSPIVLIMYCLFSEFRIEDSVHNHRLLISEIVILIIQIVAVVLLAYFGLLTLPDRGGNSDGETTTQLIYLSFYFLNM